jgi:hypothetical protein
MCDRRKRLKIMSDKRRERGEGKHLKKVKGEGGKICLKKS